jgi:cytochrome c
MSAARKNAGVAATALGVLFAASPGAAQTGDPVSGAKVFQACAACHSVKAGDHMTGPSLAHIWNSKAGASDDFQRYSDAMKNADMVWNASTLDKWLANPERFLPGSAMTFPGLQKPADRQDVIAYLKAVSENKAPAVKQQGRGMMMGGGKIDLKRAPPEGQVTSIGYCRDTYMVQTADGKIQKVWEFNLRFKTDSSKEGPPPGKPVIVGAGMQGDRASVVFTSPAEISSFIKQSCEKN